MRYEIKYSEFYALIVDDTKAKAIAHRPLKDAPYLDGVPVLPPFSRSQEDDVEQLAREEILYNDSKREWWKQGYNKAREKYKFSEEQVREAIRLARIEFDEDRYPIIDIQHPNEIIESIKKPKMPVAFDLYMTHPKFGEANMISEIIANNQTYLDELIPKTITDADGRQQWQGSYIYNTK